MSVLYTNNATTTLSASITNSTTSLSVASGTGSLFPAITGSDFFFVTISNSAGTNEIVKVTARSVDTLTIVRAQDGTSAAAWSAGDKVELRITKAMLDQFKNDITANLSAHTGNTSNPHSVTATQVGLGNVENKSSSTIRGEITSSNVTTALGFTPYNATNPSGFITSSASITGNAATATKLQTARTINGVSFDGSANITVAPADGSVTNQKLSLSTVAKFDDSTSPATTAFVRRALGNAADMYSFINATATLDTTFVGRIIVSGGGGNTLTLPLASSVLQGSKLAFFSQGGTLVLNRQGSSDTIFVGNQAYTSFNIVGCDYCEFVSDGSNWVMSNGPHLLGKGGGGMFANNLNANGYQKLPNGIIIQWGVFTQNNVTDLAITFPITYTSTVGFVTVAMNTRTGGYDQYLNGIIAYGVALNGFTSHNRVDSNSNIFRWLAIGY